MEPDTPWLSAKAPAARINSETMMGRGYTTIDFHVYSCMLLKVLYSSVRSETRVREGGEGMWATRY